MVKIIKIIDAKEQLAGSIQGTIFYIGEERTGPGKNGTWKVRSIGISDGNDKEKDAAFISAFNEKIKLFEKGHTYKIEFPNWKQSQMNDKTYINCTIGKGTIVTDLSAQTQTTPPAQSTKVTPPTQVTQPSQVTPPKNNQPSPSQIAAQNKKEKLNSCYTAGEIAKIQTWTKKLYGMRQIITETLKEFDANPNPAMVGQFMNFIKEELEC